MTENKDVKQGSVLRSVPLLAAANLLFFCLEFILAIEARSASLFARFSSTIILIPTCFLFWMIGANYYGAAIPSAAPLAATGAALLLTNIACLVMPKHGMFAHLAGSLSDIRNHAIMNTVIVLAAFLTWASGTMWPDVLGALGILYVNASAAEHIWLSARESPTIDA